MTKPLIHLVIWMQGMVHLLVDWVVAVDREPARVGGAETGVAAQLRHELADRGGTVVANNLKLEFIFNTTG